MENWAKELMIEYPEEYFGNLSKNLDPYVWTKESKIIRLHMHYLYLHLYLNLNSLIF